MTELRKYLIQISILSSKMSFNLLPNECDYENCKDHTSTYVLYQLNPSMKISIQACTINVLVHVIGMLHIL